MNLVKLALMVLFLLKGSAMVKEVPGGCMCCTAGLPMSVGINALLRQKPDHLIIEPTGLGHPKKSLLFYNQKTMKSTLI